MESVYRDEINSFKQQIEKLNAQRLGLEEEQKNLFVENKKLKQDFESEKILNLRLQQQYAVGRRLNFDLISSIRYLISNFEKVFNSLLRRESFKLQEIDIKLAFIDKKEIRKYLGEEATKFYQKRKHINTFQSKFDRLRDLLRDVQANQFDDVSVRDASWAEIRSNNSFIDKLPIPNLELLLKTYADKKFAAT